MEPELASNVPHGMSTSLVKPRSHLATDEQGETLRAETRNTKG